MLGILTFTSCFTEGKDGCVYGEGEDGGGGGLFDKDDGIFGEGDDGGVLMLSIIDCKTGCGVKGCAFISCFCCGFCLNFSFSSIKFLFYFFKL